MSEPSIWDAVVVGSGPNGLSAAITLAEAGLSVRVLEQAATPGGGCRTAELTLPGFRHDVCSAVHPLALGGPFFGAQPLAEHGLEWISPDVSFAHPLEDGTAVLLERSVEATAAGLGVDGPAYVRLLGGFSKHFTEVTPTLFERWSFPKRPFVLARFGLSALRSARALADSRFKSERARALFAGSSAHNIGSLDAPFTAAMGLMLHATAHAVGWSFPKRGAGSIVEALVARLRSLGGDVETGREVRSLEDIPRCRMIFFDTTPRQMLRIAGNALKPRYRQRLERFRYGPGVFKLDYALSQPIPWTAKECLRAGTVHVGGTFEEIAASEQAVVDGKVPERPFLLVAQHTLFDPSRAPEGKHTGWVYCHVPHGSPEDMTARIEAQLERFAPGFRDTVLARASMGPGELERYNPNYLGGDIAAGSHEGLQLLARPLLALNPYRTSDPRIFICSASTPPGAGVHGMCGVNAARAALRIHHTL
jgi:phytoene dehydrogenase-like protein